MKKFNPFDRVLVRQSANHVWSADFYDRYDRFFDNHVITSGATVEDTDILPYNKETEYLHGTVGEFTKWVPKKGEPILVKDNDNECWTIRIFLHMEGNRYACSIYADEECCASFNTWDCAKPYVNPFKE